MNIYTPRGYILKDKGRKEVYLMELIFENMMEKSFEALADNVIMTLKVKKIKMNYENHKPKKVKG